MNCQRRHWTTLPQRPQGFATAKKSALDATATVTREMIGAAHDVMLTNGDFVLSYSLLERIYLAMDAKRHNAKLTGDPAGRGASSEQSERG